ncbi:hypothetical protein V7O62_08715 [Methanolobus sp. ZRKC2]|uniref:hypothetical protein n=1 Tax=Methanolobus sp. ZRKC2 TaxID=3125783 RepID=UPI003255BF80
MIANSFSLSLSLFTTSAVLLGITFATLNFTHSTLLNPLVEEPKIKLHNKDYKQVLIQTSKYLVIAGIIFVINIALNLCFLCCNDFTYLDISVYLFVIGCVLIAFSLLTGKISLSFHTPSDEKAPEIKTPEIETPET